MWIPNKALRNNLTVEEKRRYGISLNPSEVEELIDQAYREGKDDGDEEEYNRGYEVGLEHGAVYGDDYNA